MYIVLGVLYESFIHPITLLSTLPRAAIDAPLALIVGGAGLDIIDVMGIVKNRAVLMITA